MGKDVPSQVIGYKYFVGMHMVLSHTMDALKAIVVGEKIAWTGTSTGGRISIDLPELFGGEGKEGGIAGDLDVEPGGAAQAQNDYLVSVLGDDIPAYRGVVSVILRQFMVCSTNPYPKPWSFLVKRTTCNWYNAKATIGADMNPAHMIYEALTDITWGMGYPSASLDDAAFTVAADTLYSESFGLSMLWTSEQTIEDFVKDVLRHIDGVLFVHPRTGLWILRLLRNDYDPGELNIYGPSDIVELRDFQRQSWAEITNEVTIKYTEVGAISEETRSLKLQNLAAIAVQGGVIPVTHEYHGITSGSLASKVASRDLAQVCSMLARATIICKRTMSDLVPGDVFKLSWPAYGIESLIVRVADVNLGSLTDGKITIGVIEDRFGLGAAIVGAPPPSGWTDPISLPLDSPHRQLVEAPYYVVVKSITGDNMEDYDPLAGILTTLASKPTSDALSYRMMLNVSGSYVRKGYHPFTPTALLDDGIDASDTLLTLAEGIDLQLVEADTLAYLETEIVLVKSVLSDYQVTVSRGVLDTTPKAHSAGTRIWFPALAHQGILKEEHLQGETLTVKLLPKTGKGTLALADASVNTLTLAARAIKPYAPGNVKINGSAWPASITGDLVLTWSHRSRTQQTAYVVEQTEGNIGPEAGTTYTLRIYNQTGTLLTTVTGETGTTYTYTLAQETIDNGGSPCTSLKVQIEAVRDGHTSWHYQERSFGRT